MSEIRKSGKQQMCDLAALLLLSPLSCVLQLFKVLILEKGEGKARCRFHSSSKSHLVEQLTGFYYKPLMATKLQQLLKNHDFAGCSPFRYLVIGSYSELG